jgi:hypothetical protein
MGDASDTKELVRPELPASAPLKYSELTFQGGEETFKAMARTLSSREGEKGQEVWRDLGQAIKATSELRDMRKSTAPMQSANAGQETKRAAAIIASRESGTGISR